MTTDISPARGTDALKIEMHGRVLTIGIDRPEKRNALNDTTMSQIDAVFSDLPEEAGAVVVYSTSDNFSAGLDLSELSERDAMEGVMHSRAWHSTFEKIQFGRLPVIAALRGAVIGGGLELAAAAHIRVAERSAYYALPEGARGIFVGGGASVRLPRLIGVARMMDMMMTGRQYSAEDGQMIGLSQYLVEPGHGYDKAIELAAKVADNAPMTNFSLIHVLPRIADADPAMGFVAEALTSAIAQSTPEAKSRIRAFLDKKSSKISRAPLMAK